MATQDVSAAIPATGRASLETPSMREARLKWEARQLKRTQEREAAGAAGGSGNDPSLVLDTTLVTESMGSQEEEAAFTKSKSCVSGQSKAQLTGPTPVGYKDAVERTFQYDAEKAIRLGKTTKRRSYPVTKPYFQY
mmetsp:Transcript_25953/g.68104  ORF Transcript_25953/g.68104 Transcript_25953/m.68104 type:complete len:136 (-) Transcript_25953:20-427(-)